MRSGLDLTHIDKNVRPQDDLFRFMNGKWLTESKIPDDRASDGAFYWLYEQAEKQVKQIILDQAQLKAAVGSNAQKIGDLYNSFMDEEFIQAQGLSPIAADLKAAQSFKSLDEFLTLLGELEARGLSGLFYTYVSTDNKDSTKNIVYLGQSGLSLPDEAYYREDEYQEIRESFLAHIQKMFELAKLENPSQSAQEVLSIETKIASFHWDQVKDRDAELTYNKMDFDQLIKLAPSFNWPLWIEKSQTPAHVLSQVIVRQPSYLEGLGKLLSEFDLDAWPVGQIYVQRHFGEAAKERMVELVKNLITAYRTSIEGLDWMSQETKEKAFVKLEKFTPKIGYPDKWRDYSKLSIKPKDLIGNLAAISKYSQEYEYAKIGKPVDKAEWYMTPQTVNAYYNPGMNEIVFPAAILQPPFFDVLADDDAANYGGIGAVIGHEIGHGFDDQGSKYDGDGNLVNWWSDGDRAEFEKRTNKLIDQYNQLSPAAAPDVKVNGALTVGENIGDLGGLTIAYKAYEISLAGQEPPEIDGYTGAQRFFMGWAQSWRGKYRAEEVRRRIATDPHSPDEFRCNQIVANLDEFYRAFSISEKDQHFMPADSRVRIW